MGRKIGEVVEIERNRIRPFAEQPREYFDQDKLKDLARSIRAVGQQDPVKVRHLVGESAHDYELIDGQRRWLACKMAGLKMIKAIVRDDAHSPDDQLLISVVSNFAREGHSPLEVAKTIARIRKRPEIQAIATREGQAQAIGDMFGRTFGWVYGYESLLRLAPEIQKLMSPALPDNRRLSFRAAQYISALQAEQQIQIVGQMFAKQLNRQQAEKVARRAARKHGIQVSGRRSPVKTRMSFLSDLHALRQAGANLLDTGAADFSRMFEALPRSERESALFRIEHCIGQLTQLKQAIARMLRAGAEAKSA